MGSNNSRHRFSRTRRSAALFLRLGISARDRGPLRSLDCFGNSPFADVFPGDDPNPLSSPQLELYILRDFKRPLGRQTALRQRVRVFRAARRVSPIFAGLICRKDSGQETLRSCRMLALLKHKTEKRNFPLFVLTKFAPFGRDRRGACFWWGTLRRQSLLGSDYRFFCYPGWDGFDLLLITLPV